MAADETSVPVDRPASAHSSGEDPYRPLFALSPQPAWVYDLESLRFLEVNDAAVRTYGWSEAEFLSLSLRDIRPPSEQELLTQAVALAGEGPPRFHTALHRTKDGRELRVDIHSYPLILSGRHARMVVIHDVTAQHQAREALVRSEAKYRSVIEQMKDVFFRLDQQGNWTLLNSAWTELTGYSVAETIGTSYLNYVHPSDRRTLLESMRSATADSDTAVVEIRYFRRDGGYRWVEASTRIIRAENGQRTDAMGTLRDITERRAAEQERERLATSVRQLLDSSGEGIYGLDARGMISFVNRRGSELLGYQKEELIGQHMHSLTHHSRPDGSPYPIAECPIARTIATGEPCEVDDEVMWKRTGEAVPVEYSASPLIENGRLAGAVVNFRDITARRRSELELIVARDAAEEANRAKSDFLARMSHELRTPLNSIIGFANVLLKNRTGDLKESDLSYLTRIATNGRHLLGIINDILDLSKIEAGRMTLDMAPMLLGGLVNETLEELESQTRDRGVTLRAELPFGERPIESDEGRLKQVIINLVGNALKFTERGEVVVAVETDAEGFPRTLAVRDCGIGIPADRLDAIFNVFEQAESMTARRYGGTGLGLAISRSLCELMGHRLEVSSVEGEGTTMTVRLARPTSSRVVAAPAPRTAAMPTPRSSAVIAQPTVLLVDDDQDATELLSDFVEEVGCRIVVATSGIEALRIARETMPALIFLDLRLPKISGFDVLRILKSDEVLRDVPVVIVSVVGTESRSALTGAAAIMDKPLDRDRVLEVIGQLVQLPRA